MYTNINLSEVLNIDKDSKPYIDYIAFSEFNNIFNPKLTTHQLTEVMYILNGSGKLFLDGEIYDLNKDDVFIVHPNILHGEYVVKGKSLSYYIIGIQHIRFSSENNLPLFMNAQLSPTLKFYIHQIFEEAKNSNTQQKQALLSLTDLFLIEMNRLFMSKTEFFLKNNSNDLVSSVKKYLTENFSEQITMEDLCKKFYCNPSTLAHNFKKQVGISVINFLLNKRLEEAKTWLTISNQPIAFIASITGFSSTTFFTTFFKKQTGLSPKEYRKKYMV